MTQCLGLQLQDSQADTSWVTWTSLACSSPSGVLCAKKVHKSNGYIHGRKIFRTLTCNDGCWAPKFPPPNCWMVHNFEETSLWLSLPCPTYPLLATARKEVWTECTSGLTSHMGGENFIFIPACSWGMPVSRLLWPPLSYSFTCPRTPLSPVLTTALTPPQKSLILLPQTEQELPGMLAQHNMLSSRAKPRSPLLPTLCRFFLVQ